jgi:hypothetical protein
MAENKIEIKLKNFEVFFYVVDESTSHILNHDRVFV